MDAVTRQQRKRIAAMKEILHKDPSEVHYDVLVVNDPTQAEIAQVAAEIRKGWTPRERKRARGSGYQAWTVPISRVSEVKR